MSTIGISMWRADFSRHFTRRVEHLLEKSGVDHWVFVVRKTNDLTFDMLSAVAASRNITVAMEEWTPPSDRMLRLSLAGDLGISEALRLGASRVLWHESDLISPPDLVGLLERTQAAVVGGWPVMAHKGIDTSLHLTPNGYAADGEPFYDTWGYRLGGKRFENRPPYHDGYPPVGPFRLDSVGSVALIDASYLRSGARFGCGAFVALCQAVSDRGGEIWCDPSVPVVQPLELWEFNDD